MFIQCLCPKSWCFCFHNDDEHGHLRNGDYFVMNLAHGCGGWDFELHWAKFDTRMGFNSASKYLCLVLKFDVLNLYASMLLSNFFWSPK
jgi:hypothetical protein